MTEAGQSMWEGRGVGEREAVSFRVREKDRNPAHVRLLVYAGRGDGHRALAGELCLRVEEVEPFRAALEAKHD